MIIHMFNMVFFMLTPFTVRVVVTMRLSLLLMIMLMACFVMTLDINVMYRNQRSETVAYMRVCMLGVVGVMLFGVVTYMFMVMVWITVSLMSVFMLNLSETLEET